MSKVEPGSPKIEPGSPAAEIIAEEERLHAQVQARIAMGAAPVDRVTASDFDRELIELRDAIAEAKPEDVASLVEQMTRLSAVRGRLGKSLDLPVDAGSPYFAHMVLRQLDNRRDVLVGKRGFIDRAANVQIVDWRNAPVSQIYYRYDEGDDYEETIDGRHLSGILETRRNISITGGQLRRIGTPGGTYIRDAHKVWHEAVGAALPTLQGGAGKAARAPRLRPQPGRGRRRRRRDPRALGVDRPGSYRADKHLPEIAALIDREQFDLITRPENGIVVVQGGAGSGKTTLALHRVAYLNFVDRQRFQSRNVLIVVPTEGLARYVSGVLPALGVNGVVVQPQARWARAQRRALLPESSRKSTDDTPDEVARIKKHPFLLSLLEEFVAEQVRAVEPALREVGGESAAVLVSQWQSRAEQSLVPRLRGMRKWLERPDNPLTTAVRQRCQTRVGELVRRADDIVADWEELLTSSARLSEGVRAAGVDDIRDGDIERTVAWCVAQHAPAAEAEVGSDGQPIEAVDGRALDEGDVGGRFDEHDDPILLRLVQLKRGGLVRKDGREIVYEHIAIDEAQDRSALEVKVMLEAARAPNGDRLRRSVTIAGDTAQRFIFDNGFSGWDDLLSRTGHSGITVEPLRLSYRSTAEVMAFSRAVLGPELEPDEPLVARSGAPVDLHQFGGTGEAVAFLGEALRELVSRERNASVAVIARYPEQADTYYEALRRAEVPALRRVSDHEFCFESGVDVTDLSQVKGLEFDYVILVDVTGASYPDHVEARHLLHVGATRAAHQLWLVATGPVSPLVPAELVED